jgi:F-type H+-transporting ATPase subunit a
MSSDRLLAEFDPLRPVIPVSLFTFSIGPWQIIVSNHMFMVAVVMVVLIILILPAARAKGMVPRGARNLIELICVYFREEVARPILGSRTDSYIGFIWTVFFFILGLNLFAMIPLEKIITLLTGKESHLGGPATANIWITGAMAVVAFLMTHISGIREQGLWHYIVNFAPPVPWWLMPIIYFLEILSAFVKPFTLAIRLFANIIAGHMVLASILGLIFVFKSYGIAAISIAGAVALSFLELLIAFVQAYIFTFLSAFYIGSSIAPEH